MKNVTTLLKEKVIDKQNMIFEKQNEAIERLTKMIEGLIDNVQQDVQKRK